jgi:chitinase
MTGCALNWQGFKAGRSPNCSTSDGILYFDDLLSLEEKVAEAKRQGLGGISWWAMGGEVSGIWTMVQKYYPR